MPGRIGLSGIGPAFLVSAAAGADYGLNLARFSAAYGLALVPIVLLPRLKERREQL